VSNQWQNRECRLMELLADRAVFGLECGEEKQLRRLLQTIPGFDTECMERAAATVLLAFASVEPLPADVRARIRATGMRHLRGPSQGGQLGAGPS